jgi:hypothetical protein
MAFTCNDLRLGGTLAGTGITGGTSINSTALEVDDWSGILGNPGLAYTPFESAGRPGAWIVGDGLPRARLLNLNMRFTRFGPVNSALTEPTPQEQLVANTDIFLALLRAPQYLEIDLPDLTSRFTQVVALDPSFMVQPELQRTLSVPLFSTMSNWKAGGNQSTDTIAAPDTLVVGGNVNVYDAVLVFSGDGTFTNSTAGWSLTIAGSTGPVTVDLGARTVVQAGIPADNLLTRTDASWGWFLPGSNTVTSSVSVGVTWRSQFA